MLEDVVLFRGVLKLYDTGGFNAVKKKYLGIDSYISAMDLEHGDVSHVLYKLEQYNQNQVKITKNKERE